MFEIQSVMNWAETGSNSLAFDNVQKLNQLRRLREIVHGDERPIELPQPLQLATASDPSIYHYERHREFLDRRPIFLEQFRSSSSRRQSLTEEDADFFSSLPVIYAPPSPPPASFRNSINPNMNSMFIPEMPSQMSVVASKKRKRSAKREELVCKGLYSEQENQKDSKEISENGSHLGRIRVWSDAASRIYYDCCCGSRKPTSGKTKQ